MRAMQASKRMRDPGSGFPSEQSCRTALREKVTLIRPAALGQLAMKGKIPPRVVFFSRPPKEVRDLRGEPVAVLPTYPAYPESAPRMSSGEEWARHQPRWQREEALEGEPTTSGCLPNRVTGLQILSLEVRGEGGRAYKVMDSERRLFDLREEALLDIMQNVGIEPGGGLPGDYVFAVQGSQFNLIRIGSRLYDEIRAEEARFARRAPTGEGRLELGRIYTTRGGKKLAYLGTYYTRPHEYHAARYEGIDYYAGRRPTHPERVVPTGPVERFHFWYSPYTMRAEEPLEELVRGYFSIERTKSVGSRYPTEEVFTAVAALETPERFLEAFQRAAEADGAIRATLAELKEARIERR